MLCSKLPLGMCEVWKTVSNVCSSSPLSERAVSIHLKMVHIYDVTMEAEVPLHERDVRKLVSTIFVSNGLFVSDSIHSILSVPHFHRKKPPLPNFIEEPPRFSIYEGQEIVQNRSVSKLFRTFTTFPSQGTGKG